ncbi:hypothetical protein UFOVP972_105 [uncultured Caudovirales phage]|uniref:Uncharacterized protein n=1 Tax=uncultured Caudovirales phage TaxID=2100421 RepID=A0A6J5PTH5_9CAUD|nr:hypothetical protein UFOVP972_105 [uncultured Caudovirales phage]
MSRLRFTDGEEFDLSGPIRKEERYDGWYVIGENRLIPVKDEEEADRVMAEIFNYSGIADGVCHLIVSRRA